MKICIISPNYPHSKRSIFTFVKQLVDEFVNAGHECCVIAPYILHKDRRLFKFRSIDRDGKLVIIRPLCLSLSMMRVGDFVFSDFFRRRAIELGLRHLPWKPDAMYCHFWLSGVCSYRWARKHNVPLFVASGESEIRVYNSHGQYDELRDYLSGCICVSEKNMKESILKRLVADESMCKVLPNAANIRLFRRMDRKLCREKLKIAQEIFVIISVGAFSERKGMRRVSEAVAELNDVYEIYLGSGDVEPFGQNILYMMSVIHEDIPLYLNAADAFVLPTLHEGCCNAIVEAMACGLPIVSSKLSFNEEILNSDNSILVDPTNIEEIRNAILQLRDDVEMRQRLAEGALRCTQKISLEERAGKIVDYIRMHI